MERLTYLGEGPPWCWQIKGADNLLCSEVCEKMTDGCNGCPISKAIEKLAAYEKFGLDPEDLDDYIPPALLGQTVWVIEKCLNINEIRDGDPGDDGMGSCTGYHCPYWLNENCPHEGKILDCEKAGSVETVFEDFVESVYLYDDVMVLTLGYCGTITKQDIGKTVFLEKEQAENVVRARRSKEGER